MYNKDFIKTIFPFRKRLHGGEEATLIMVAVSVLELEGDKGGSPHTVTFIFFFLNDLPAVCLIGDEFTGDAISQINGQKHSVYNKWT